jgi:multiple sugar transport system permease protein
VIARGGGAQLAWWQALAALGLLFFVLAPFVWIALVSLTPTRELFGQGLRYLPPFLTLENYANVFRFVSFTRAFVNSALVAVATTVVAISLSISAGYAFARYRFRGRTLLLVALLLIYMLPGIVLLVPLLVILRAAGLLNTYAGRVLAESTHAIPFAVWLLTNYFASLPRDLEDAALIDGCSRVGAMVRVTLPLAVPGIVAAGLFVFIASWNNFLFAFMFTSGESVRTLPVLLRQFAFSEATIDTGMMMAGTVMTALPVALAFLFLQRYLVGGLSAGAVKG